MDPVTRVLHLDRGEVRLGVAVEGHPSPGGHPEVPRVRQAHQPEAQPVGVVGSVAGDRREHALGYLVGPHHQRDVAHAGEDLGASDRQGGRPRGTGGVARRQLAALEAQRIREGRAGHPPRVAVADRIGPGHELDLVPVDTGVVEGLAGRGHTEVDEVLAGELAPLVHPDAEDRDLSDGHQAALPARGCHFHTM